MPKDESIADCANLCMRLDNLAVPHNATTHPCMSFKIEGACLLLHVGTAKLLRLHKPTFPDPGFGSSVISDAQRRFVSLPSFQH